MSFDTSGRGWISHGFEELVADPAVFDVLIIGSGYGGSIAAATLAGRTNNLEDPIRVGVLERGQEYLAGAFPSGPDEAPGHIRLGENKDGLFDIRLGAELNTVIANGLGGGSLFNAGVMEVPRAEVFNKGWPANLTRAQLDPYFDRVRVMLGSAQQQQNGTLVDNTIADHPDGVPAKYTAIKNLANGSFRDAAITVAMDDTVNSANVQLNKCIRCGDCATGCNFGAKNSLDLNLLVQAHRAGAMLYTGATVLHLERDGQFWVANCVYTNQQMRDRQGEPLKVRARHIVLAAGTLGTPEILARTQASQPALQFSTHLLQRCSGNGDMLITDYNTGNDVNAVADQNDPPSTRAIGPTITGVIDQRDSHGMLFEEMAVPATLQRVFTEVFGTTHALYQLDVVDRSKHEHGFPDNDIYAIGADHVRASGIYAAMGDDGAAGNIAFRGPDSANPQFTNSNDGIAYIAWDDQGGRQPLPDLDLFTEQVARFNDLKGSADGTLPNPVWRLLPDGMSFLINDQRGPLLTVHPLGGCVMADDAATGAVDEFGRVYNAQGGVHEGLAVLDGSMVPTALGTNPALTIAAVALRAAEELAKHWAPAPAVVAGQPDQRPVFRGGLDVAATQTPTEMGVNERLGGRVTFRDDDGNTHTDARVELTLQFVPVPFTQMFRPPRDGGNPVLQVDTTETNPQLASRLRIFVKAEDTADGERQIFSAPVSGRLFVLQRQRSRRWGRILRTFWPWLRNRGARDIYQAIVDGGGDGPGPWARFLGMLALASRGGERRNLRYELTVGNGNGEIALRDNEIVGVKLFSYTRRCNPWRQLMEIELEEFPGLRGSDRQLVLDLDFLADIGVPLIRIARQDNAVHGLADMFSFFAWLTRQLIGIHMWSFRAPDQWKNKPVDNTLPLPLPEVPGFEEYFVDMDAAVPHHEPDGAPIASQAKLTRYPNPASVAPPIVMIHGYSASGASFAHPAVDDSYASHFWKQGRDVWVLDMRTSPGYPDTARRGWSFEQVAHNDIPLAIDQIIAITGQPSVDVIAHCMGSAMFSMAILRSHTSYEDGLDAKRLILPERINRAVLTQVGPLVVFSPINRFRGLIARYLTEFLPDEYSFQPENASLADNLLDRVLTTVPYPEPEFDIENPGLFWKRTAWTRTRHRMDALYGRDFNVDQIDDSVLQHIDDFFGAMSIKSVSQTIHFSRFSTITDVDGHNEFVSRKFLEDYWKFPTLSLHGSDNGLSDVATLDRMARVLRDAGRTYEKQAIEGAGHQDLLIGDSRAEALSHMDIFLATDTVHRLPETGATTMEALVPWIGPLITQDFSDLNGPFEQKLVTMRIGADPLHNEPAHVSMLPAFIGLDGVPMRPADNQPFTQADIEGSMWTAISDVFKKERFDKFLIPPELFNVPGANAVLVMILYAEDLALPLVPQHHYYFKPAMSEAGAFGNLSSFANQLDFAAAPLRAMSITITSSTLLNVESGIDIEPERWSAMASKLVETFTAVMNSSGDHVSMLNLSDGAISYDPAEPDENPDPAGVRIAFGSCQYPAPFIDRDSGYASFADLDARLAGNGDSKPDVIVLAGDQVYVDATAGLFDPTAKDDSSFEKPYEHWLRNRHVRSVLRKVPAYMVLDDHEIKDNWQPLPGNTNQPIRDRAVRIYERFQRGLIVEAVEETTQYRFRTKGYRFFMLDSRSHRDPRTVATIDDVHIADLSPLKDWLSASTGPRFVVSASMFLPRHRRSLRWKKAAGAIQADSWEGYPASLYEILAYIADNQLEQVIFLSGDEHLGCVARIEITRDGGFQTINTVSLHTSPLYAPMPFANSLAEDLAGDEQFSFELPNGNSYTCRIHGTQIFPHDDGFTHLQVQRPDQTWLLHYQFPGTEPQTIPL